MQSWQICKVKSSFEACGSKGSTKWYGIDAICYSAKSRLRAQLMVLVLRMLQMSQSLDACNQWVTWYDSSPLAMHYAHMGVM